VVDLDSLRQGRGQFETEAEFYAYWRAYPFKTGKQIEKELNKAVLAARAAQAPQAEAAARAAAEQVRADMARETGE
jgi:hypothetical protein